MKKTFKLFCLSLAVVMGIMSLTSCGVQANTVFSVDDLYGKTIGVQLGTTGDIYASAYEEEGVTYVNDQGTTGVREVSKVERYKKGSQAVLALKQGKIDCVIIDSEPAKAFVEKNKGLKILSEEFAVEDYAICLAKGNTELTNEFNTALATLKENGTIKQIISNFIGDDTKGTCPYVSPENVDTSKGTLTMATNAEFEPYEYIAGEKVVGIDAQIAQAICDLLGYKLKITNIDFDSIISSVQTGKADFGMAGMTVTEDRKKSINFTDPYTTATQVVIVRSK